MRGCVGGAPLSRRIRGVQPALIFVSWCRLVGLIRLRSHPERSLSARSHAQLKHKDKRSPVHPRVALCKCVRTIMFPPPTFTRAHSLWHTHTRTHARQCKAPFSISFSKTQQTQRHCNPYIIPFCLQNTKLWSYQLSHTPSLDSARTTFQFWFLFTFFLKKCQLSATVSCWGFYLFYFFGLFLFCFLTWASTLSRHFLSYNMQTNRNLPTDNVKSTNINFSGHA